MPTARAAALAAIPLVFAAALLDAGSLPAQSAAAEIRYADPIRLARAEEVALARSAAPPSVSAEATVYVLEEGATRWVVAEEGTNGAACYVSRTWEGSLEPHCFDPEGARTIFPIHLARLELGHGGAAPEEVDREIAARIRAGRLRWPTRPAMSYMLSSRQVLVSDEGVNVGAWRPHLMLYWPGLTKSDLGAAGAEPILDDSMFLEDEGTEEACLIVVYPEFVDPAPVVSAD